MRQVKLRLSTSHICRATIRELKSGWLLAPNLIIVQVRYLIISQIHYHRDSERRHENG